MSLPPRPTQVGDWFDVPLPDDTPAVGHAVRVAKGGTALVYFFAPLPSPPTLRECAALNPPDAVAALVCSGLSVETGDWPLIGTTKVDQQKWPVPEFERTQPTARGEVIVAESIKPDLINSATSWEVPAEERGTRQQSGVFGDRAAANYVAWRRKKGADPVGQQPWWSRLAIRPPEPEPSQTPTLAQERQAVIMYIPAPPHDLDEFDPLIDDLIEAIDGSGAGEFDGTLRGEDGIELYLYGPDSEPLAQVATDVAGQHNLPEGTQIEVRPGPPGTASKTRRLS